MAKKLKLEQLTIKPKKIEQLAPIILQIHGPTWNTSIKSISHNYKKSFTNTLTDLGHFYKKFSSQL